MRHISRTHRVALDWLFDRINLDSKIQIKYIDTKSQLADMLTKGNFTRDEWNHLLRLFTSSHFSSAECSEVMSKRTQKESGSREAAKGLHQLLSSTASESRGKPDKKVKIPLSAQAEMYDRTGKPVVCRDTSHDRHRLVEKAHSASYSEWNSDKTCSSKEWKSDELMDDRTERPFVYPSRRSARVSNVSLVSTRTSFWKKKITTERGDLLFALNEEHSNSSLVTTKQNQICR